MIMAISLVFIQMFYEIKQNMRALVSCIYMFKEPHLDLKTLCKFAIGSLAIFTVFQILYCLALQQMACYLTLM